MYNIDSDEIFSFTKEFISGSVWWLCVWWQHHCCCTLSLFSPAWSKLEPVHPDFACLALNSDISVFYQFWMLVLEAWTSYQWKQQLCRKQKQLSNFTQVWYEEETIWFMAEYKDEVFGAWVATEAIWGISFPAWCSLFWWCLSLPSLLLQTVALQSHLCSRWFCTHSVTWCQPEQTQMMSKWQ